MMRLHLRGIEAAYMGVKLNGFPTRQRKKAIGETISIKNHPTFCWAPVMIVHMSS
jgi:hypothetical protein